MEIRYFEIGVVTGVTGILGHIRVFPLTDNPQRFNLLKEIFLQISSESIKKYKIINLRYHKKFVILKLEDIDTPEEALKLKGAILKIPPELALPLEENQYYHRDLLDMTVINNDGTELGILVNIITTAANDVYVIKGPNGRELLIPAIKQCILNVDVLSKKMTVNLIPGLENL